MDAADFEPVDKAFQVNPHYFAPLFGRGTIAAIIARHCLCSPASGATPGILSETVPASARATQWVSPLNPPGGRLSHRDAFKGTWDPGFALRRQLLRRYSPGGPGICGRSPVACRNGVRDGGDAGED